MLIGFGVTLAVVVGIWAKDLASESGDRVVKNSERDLICSDTSIIAINSNLCTDVVPNSMNVDIKNNGRRTIRKLNIKGITCDITSTTIKTLNLKPGDTEFAVVLNSNNCKKVTIIPVIEVNNEEIICGDRIINIQC